MGIENFKLTRNRQRPDFCYNYKMVNSGSKYEIFTMNGGKTFIASIEVKRSDGRYYTEYSEELYSTDDCIDALTKNRELIK